ncbi:ThiF family adenylyltransferase [Brucella gallinifaecis]|uniref:ThiF family adenylyltransferase n=1 Tax=Brucella gallinifaecis TaxID=215590 RepID=UPI0023623498|nr:ThiF family adenylyltransferase [Brucella gallinifaecis]
MLPALFSLNPDLKQLRDEGYVVEQRGGYLVMHQVPYVNASRQVKMGKLISSLTMAGDRTHRPDTHVMFFDGEYPCHADGSPISAIMHQSATSHLGHGLTSRHSFSSKPSEGYPDYHKKMTAYANILAGPAAVLQPGLSPRVFQVPEDQTVSPFHYTETASDRAGIGALTERLEGEKVGIIGLGGTGSYILDQTAKTPVDQIHLFDGDTFLQHNAFRAPGAPSIDQLRAAVPKVEYFASIYSHMHKGIVPHVVALNASNVHLLDGITFAFLSMDAGDAKRAVVSKLEAMGVPFIDVGMGLELVDGSLGGILRVTASTPAKRDHVHNGRISFHSAPADAVYATNIQVADLNMLNAALAVMKWKKLRGFYRDLENEHHSTFTTDGNMLLNEDRP